MERIPVIFDCDTGIDDAIAILLALKIPAFDIKGFTCVAGNTPLPKVLRNTGHVLELAGVDLPVYAGADKPLFADATAPTAEHVHGKNGLGDLEFDDPKRAPESMKAWDYIYEEAKRQNGALELIATAPLTNLAMAFLKYKELPKLIRRIVIMGGAASYGNVTPAAEFNIYTDPEAAEIVFNSGVPVHMVGLDVTLKAWFNAEESEKLSAVNEQGMFCHLVGRGEMRYSLGHGFPGMCLHDPCAVIYAAYPELYKTDTVGVHVETLGKYTRGKTVTDFLSDKQFPVKNAVIVYDVDREAFRDKVFELIGSYSA
ncbi:MAG: nucleoside hydrolase [Clostridia bacterium]|nr:nucleoside hydrolase [Clostridia bacterium]